MNRIRFVGILLKPSLASIFFCVGISSLVLLISSLIYNAHNGFLYGLLFGPDSSIELIQSTRNTADAIFQTIFGNTLLNKFIFFFFWCMVGLIVYWILSGIGKTSSALSDTTERLHYLHAKKSQFEEELGLRLIVRSIGLLIAFIYGTFFFKLLLPFSLLCGRIGVSNLSSVSGWLYLLAGFIELGLSLHLFIVLVRLILLRPRLSGGWDDILDSELSGSLHY